MSKTLIDVDDEALAMAMAHYGTRVKREAVNRALREAAQKRVEQTADLEEWIADVGGRLATTDRNEAWRQ